MKGGREDDIYLNGGIGHSSQQANVCGQGGGGISIILQVAASLASSCIRPVGHLCTGPMFYPKNAEQYINVRFV